MRGTTHHCKGVATRHALHTIARDIVTKRVPLSIGEYILLVTERMTTQDPIKRRFLLRWITVLNGVPNSGIRDFLPNILDGLFNMLHDGNQESREHASEVLRDLLNQLNKPSTVEFLRMAETLIKQASSLDTLTRLNALTWINKFVKSGGLLELYYAQILGVALHCISDDEENIQVVAREINNKLRSVMADLFEMMDVHDATKLEALKWMSFLLGLHRQPIMEWYEREIYISDASFFDDVFPPGYSYQIEEIEDVVEEIRAIFFNFTWFSRMLHVTTWTVTF